MENKGQSLHNDSNENRHDKLFHFVHKAHYKHMETPKALVICNLLGSNEILCMLTKCDLVKYATETITLCYSIKVVFHYVPLLRDATLMTVLKSC